MRQARLKVDVVASARRKIYSRVLMPLDGSKLAEQVLPYAHLLGQAFGSPLHLLRVADRVPQELGDSGREGNTDAQAQAFFDDASSYLDGLESPLRAEGHQVSHSVTAGDSAAEIVAEAEHQEGAIVAVSIHGRSGIGR
jgi:nucleotide-binding universal stress UspA family protein